MKSVHGADQVHERIEEAVTAPHVFHFVNGGSLNVLVRPRGRADGEQDGVTGDPCGGRCDDALVQQYLDRPAETGLARQGINQPLACKPRPARPPQPTRVRDLTIPDDDWMAFVDAYRAADGPALPGGDPWPVLEPFARAAVVQAAAHHPDDELLLAACARMAS